MKKILTRGYLAILLLLLYAPVLILSVYSFTDSSMIGSIHGFSIKNYKVLFGRDELLQMIFGTLILAAVVAVLSGILGTLGAIGAFYSNRRQKMLIEFMNNIPIVNAEVVTGFSICMFTIVFFGINKDSYIPMIIGLTALCTPFVYLSVMPRLKQMDGQIFEAALDLGCTPVQTMFKVVLPQLIPGIVSGIMLSVTLVLDDYFITTYTKPATFDTISTYVVNATKGAQTEIKTALWALSTVVFICVILIAVGSNSISRKMEE